MRFTILTLFPEMIEQGLSVSILGRAREKGFISFDVRNIRDYTTERHGHVDDAPYGGGAGMLMQADPILRCYRAVTEERGRSPRVVYVTPQGKQFTQADDTLRALRGCRRARASAALGGTLLNRRLCADRR